MKISCKVAIRQWYRSAAGRNTAIAVQAAVADMSNDVFGYYAVQVGELAGEYTLLRDSRIRSCFSIALDSQNGSETELVADPVALPLVFDNLDLVVASHVLDCASSPHEVLREIERVLVPEGHCILIAFNPVSLRGINLIFNNLLRREKKHTLYSAFRVRDWFEVLGFEVLDVRTVGQHYDADNLPVLHRFSWFRRGMDMYARAFGQVRLIHVRKKVSKLTPWKPKVKAPQILKPGMAVNTNGVNTNSAGKTANHSQTVQKGRDEKS